MKIEPARAAGLVLLVGLFASGTAPAAGTLANTAIDASATATYTDPAGALQTATSNIATVRVDEILNLVNASNDAGRIGVTSPDSSAVLTFSVKNTGNGSEAFEFVASNLTGDDFDTGSVAIFLDNGDGIFDGDEIPYTFGSTEPTLAAEETVVVYLVAGIGSGHADGAVAELTLRATAVSASAAGDPAGTVLGGAGDGGTDAVVGISTASAVASNGFIVSAVTSTLSKSAVILDPFLGSNAVPGATITYTLSFALSGSGDITQAQVVDLIPANTSYVPNSITLNGVAQTDALDADAGRFNGNQVEVRLPDPLAAPSTQIVTFKVTIN